MQSFNSLKISQLERKFKTLRSEISLGIPKDGWIRTLRNCYGMTLRQLAKRVGVADSRIYTAEKAETKGKITVETLRRIADALNCDVFYSFVPREPITDFIARNAEKNAGEKIKTLAHSMKLEDQGLDNQKLKKLYEELLAEYLKKPTKIWGK
jgi:predicted DNA-binding mobile mystery protein A